MEIDEYIVKLKEKYKLDFDIKLNSNSNKHDYSIILNKILKVIGDTEENRQHILKLFDNEKFDISISNGDTSFLNFDFSEKYLKNIINISDFSDCYFNQDKINETVLIDYASPNIAKDLHVGHIRSIFIGDQLASIANYMGKKVLKISHVGDFGLQFGMIINYIKNKNINLNDIKPNDLQNIYTEAKKLNDKDKSFDHESHIIISSLHNDINSPYLEYWKYICQLSLSSYDIIFSILKIKQTMIPESFYIKLIPSLIKEISNKSCIHIEDGRTIAQATDKAAPLTIVKSDGGFTYATTDLAAIKYRIQEQKVDKIFYVVDTAQSEHFRQLFAVAKEIGYINRDNILEHIKFGLVLGEDKKRIKSRNGDTPKLIDMINDCIDATEKVFKEKKIEYNQELINKVAISSLRYANTALRRTTDFVFSLNKILSFVGNTYMYILYGYVRLNNIICNYEKNIKDNIKIEEDIDPNDITILKKLLKFSESIKSAYNEKEPSILCYYVFSLVESIHIHYNYTRVMQFDNDGNLISINKKRLNLIKQTKRALQEIFNILNIDLIDNI